MFGTIAASGVRIVSREPLNRRAIMIIALSLAVGLGVSQQPLILQFAPDWVKNLLSSGIAAGGITAIVLNLVFPPEKTDCPHGRLSMPAVTSLHHSRLEHCA